MAVTQFAKAAGPGPAASGEEIPDSVTAELEKLEQEEGVVGEVEGVSAILGDLVEDDDELLGKYMSRLLLTYFYLSSKIGSLLKF